MLPEGTEDPAPEDQGTPVIPARVPCKACEGTGRKIWMVVSAKGRYLKLDCKACGGRGWKLRLARRKGRLSQRQRNGTQNAVK
jgi:DnaJ-class molecular chaperone